MVPAAGTSCSTSNPGSGTSALDRMCGWFPRKRACNGFARSARAGGCLDAASVNHTSGRVVCSQLGYGPASIGGTRERICGKPLSIGAAGVGDVTAVLFSCSPQPSNFSVQELRIYRTADGGEVGRIPELPADGGVLPGVYKAGSGGRHYGPHQPPDLPAGRGRRGGTRAAHRLD